MLEATLELKEPLKYLFLNSKNLDIKEIAFSELDWLIIAKLKSLFQVFLKPSERLQGQLYITLSETLLYIYTIYNKLTSKEKEYTSYLNNKDTTLVSI
jgi:hypothetical protein